MKRLLPAMGILISAFPCLAFENAKVLPKGVRNMQFRFVSSQINEKFNESGDKERLATPLEKEVNRQELEKSKSKEDDLSPSGLNTAIAFLQTKLGDNGSLGQFKANLDINVNVMAPVVAWGITEKWTTAIALPIYSVKSTVDMGFKGNDNFHSFANELRSRGQLQSFNNLKEKLSFQGVQNKLAENGFDQLEDYSHTGLGDIKLVNRVQILNSGKNRAVALAELTLPTGKVDDENKLTDVKTGDGQTDIALGLNYDYSIIDSIYINTFAKYTYQMPSSKNFRMVEEDESVEVPVKGVTFDLGDIVNLGSSVQVEMKNGLTTGVGYNYEWKDSDRYSSLPDSSNLGENTLAYKHMAVVKLGYSTIELFRQKAFPIPLSLDISYNQLLKGKNTLSSNMFQTTLGVFF